MYNKYKTSFLNTRIMLVIYIVLAALYLVTVLIYGVTMKPEMYAVDYSAKFIPPSIKYLFGTDLMGRNMFYRCVKGLSTSLVIGVIASFISAFISLIFGVSSAIIGGKYDKFINFCVDCCMGIPHLVLIILISFMLGRGERGITIAVALTHWPELTRLVRAEVIQIRNSQFVKASYKMGKSNFWIAKEHIIPHVLPTYIVGLVLLFPHAIMHEASATFLGFGIPLEIPAIGVILSEAMKHIAVGKWWLAFFPGAMLLISVMLFDLIGESLKKLINPESGNR